MNKHQQALEQIKQIAADNKLSLADINNALGGEVKPHSLGSMIDTSEMLAYIGGILIFAGIGVYTTMFWQDLSSVFRIALTFGSGLSCYCVALGLSKDKNYEKVTQALFLISAILQPTGLYVFLNETFPVSNDYHLATLFVFGIMFFQQLVTFLEKQLNIVLFFTLFFGYGFVATLFDYYAFNSNTVSMVLGTSLFLLIYSFTKESYRPGIGFWYFIATFSFLGGAYGWIYNTSFEVLFLGLCCFTIYVSTLVKSKAILFVGTMGLLAYIGRYTMLHFVNSVGWPISLIILGAAFIFFSGVALRIKKKYM